MPRETFCCGRCSDVLISYVYTAPQPVRCASTSIGRSGPLPCHGAAGQSWPQRLLLQSELFQLDLKSQRLSWRRSRRT